MIAQFAREEGVHRRGGKPGLQGFVSEAKLHSFLEVGFAMGARPCRTHAQETSKCVQAGSVQSTAVVGVFLSLLQALDIIRLLPCKYAR